MEAAVSNARMKPDPAFATSLICVTDKDYEFFVDPEIQLIYKDNIIGISMVQHGRWGWYHFALISYQQAVHLRAWE